MQFRALFLTCCILLLASASNALAAQLIPYSATAVFLNPDSNYPITRLNDTFSDRYESHQGFVGQQTGNPSLGEIHFVLPNSYDVSAISIWNNIAWTSNGIKDLTLTFLDAGGNQVGAPFKIKNIPQYYYGPPAGKTAPLTFDKASFAYKDVKRITMRFDDLYGQVEIRQIEFYGELSRPGATQISNFKKELLQDCDQLLVKLTFDAKTDGFASTDTITVLDNLPAGLSYAGGGQVSGSSAMVSGSVAGSGNAVSASIVIADKPNGITASFSITFKAAINPSVFNAGQYAQLENQAVLTTSNDQFESYLSDDPGKSGVADPTVLTVDSDTTRFCIPGIEVSKTCSSCTASQSGQSCTAKCQIAVTATGPLPPGSIYVSEHFLAEIVRNGTVQHIIRKLGPAANWTCTSVSGAAGVPFASAVPLCTMPTALLPPGKTVVIPVELGFADQFSTAEALNCLVAGVKSKSTPSLPEQRLCIVPDGTDTPDLTRTPDTVKPPVFAVSKSCQPCVPGPKPGQSTCACQVTVTSSGGNPAGLLTLQETLETMSGAPYAQSGMPLAELSAQSVPAGTTCTQAGSIASHCDIPSLASLTKVFQFKVTAPNGSPRPFMNCARISYSDKNGFNRTAFPPAACQTIN